MLCRPGIRSLQLQRAHIYQSSRRSRILRKAPECKFESDDCPPRRCVPPTTVCHTLPKQKCAIKVKQSPKPKEDISVCPSPCAPTSGPPCLKIDGPEAAAKHTRGANIGNQPWYKNMLPDEENLGPAGKMAYRFVKFNAKALIAGGSVYFTAKCGIWGNNEQTAELYKNTHNSVTSLIKSNAGKVADVPDSREIAAACKHYWNKGVILTISSLLILPATMKKWGKELYKQISDSIAAGESSKS